MMPLPETVAVLQGELLNIRHERPMSCFSTSATTCVVLCLRTSDGRETHTSMSHLDRPVDLGFVQSLLRGIGIDSSSSSAALSTAVYIVGGFTGGRILSSVKRSLDAFASSLPSSWDWKVLVDNTGESNRVYKRVKHGKRYNIQCILENETLREETLEKNAAAGLLEGRCDDLILPFPSCTSLLVRQDGSCEAWHDDEPPSTVRALHLEDVEVVGSQQRQSAWMQDAGPRDCFGVDERGVFYVDVGDCQSVMPEGYVISVLNMFDDLAAAEKEGRKDAAEILVINLMNRISTSPWCEPDDMKDNVLKNLTWYRKGGEGGEGGTWRWLERTGPAMGAVEPGKMGWFKD